MSKLTIIQNDKKRQLSIYRIIKFQIYYNLNITINCI